MRGPHRFGMSAMFFLFTLSAACGGDSPPPTGPGDTTGDGDVGSIQVTTETSGELDPDGYLVAVDGGSSHPIEANGSLTFADVPPGAHEISISGLAINCETNGADAQTAEVVAHEISIVSFHILCSPTSLIAFAGVGSEGSGIYTIGPNSAAAEFVVAGGQPKWSPDGQRIAFRREGAQAGIEVVNRDGTGLRRVVDLAGISADFAWSPDGSSLVYDMGDGADASIYTVDLNGLNSFRVTNDAQADREPVWSADGKWIAFERFSDASGYPDIFRVDANGANQVQLTINPDEDEDPIWSPDGTRIAYERRYDSGGESYKAITTITPDGSGVTDVGGGLGGDEDAAWSPDGTRIAFSSYRDGSRDIYVVRADGSGLLRLTSDPTTADRYPTWSPEGDRIAFCQSARDGSGSAIAIVAADGSGETRLLPAGGCRPVWSPSLF